MARAAHVTFRFQAEPGRRVELAGDFPLWTARHALAEHTPGDYAVTLSLEPGLYRYKFVLDGRHWVCDPGAPTDTAEGNANSVLLVGGTRPPLFFAEDRRHLTRAVDGTLRVRAELEGAGAPPPAIWARSAGGRRWSTPLLEIGRQGERRLLAADLPLPRDVKKGAWGFEGLEETFVLPAPRPRSAARPAWAASATWYAIFLDRWHRGGARADPRASSRDTATRADTFYGGDLEGVRAALPYLSSLGVDGVLLTPLHRSETPHRYDTVDHSSIDPRLGGKRALRSLLDAAHERGLRVAVDLSFTHVHAAHPFFRDVLRRQRRSRYAKWFQVASWPVREGDRATYRCYVGRTELPLLELEHAPARKHVIDAALELVRLGVDALRLDAMTDAPPRLWRELRAAVRRVAPEVALLGEVVMDAQPRCLEDEGADAVTDFQHREALRRLCTGQLAPEQFLAWTRFLEHRQGPFDAAARWRLLDTHDTERFASQVGAARARLALAMLLFRPEPVWLTYGTERELAANVPLFRLDDAWPERLPMPPLDAPPPPTFGVMQTLLRLRRALDATSPLRAEARGSLLWLERDGAEGTLRLALNFSDQPSESGLSPDATPLLGINEGEGPVARPLGPWAARLVAPRGR